MLDFLAMGLIVHEDYYGDVAYWDEDGVSTFADSFPRMRFDPRNNRTAAGRRMRVIAPLLSAAGSKGNKIYLSLKASKEIDRTPTIVTEDAISYAQAMEMIDKDPTYAEARDRLSKIQLRYITSGAVDHELHFCLQDLGDEINWDIHEACAAFDNPDVWYPGVDDEIEPVTDEHIDKVIDAMQRELNRELRGTPLSGSKKLPAAPLAKLPQRVKRALVERRRYRFLQYGITKKNWEDNVFSVWNVREDPEFIPRRHFERVPKFQGT